MNARLTSSASERRLGAHPSQPDSIRKNRGSIVSVDRKTAEERDARVEWLIEESRTKVEGSMEHAKAVVEHARATRTMAKATLEAARRHRKSISKQGTD